MPFSLARPAIELTRLLAFAAGRQGLRFVVAAAVEHSQGLSRSNVKNVGENKAQFALLAIGVFRGATIY
jgi:hypothetical protein